MAQRTRNQRTFPVSHAAFVAIAIAAGAARVDAQLLSETRSGIWTGTVASTAQETHLHAVADTAFRGYPLPLWPFIVGGVVAGAGYEALVYSRNVQGEDFLFPVSVALLVTRGTLIGGATGVMTGTLVRAIRANTSPRHQHIVLIGGLLGAGVGALAMNSRVSGIDENVMPASVLVGTATFGGATVGAGLAWLASLAAP